MPETVPYLVYLLAGAVALLLPLCIFLLLRLTAASRTAGTGMAVLQERLAAKRPSSSSRRNCSNCARNCSRKAMP